MKNLLVSMALLVLVSAVSAQNKSHKVGISTGPAINHYNGNLGNSFFSFKTTCFGGEVSTLGIYLGRSLDLNLGHTVGDFGYCQTEADKQRVVSAEFRCPGCTNTLGMGELRSRMVAVNAVLKYKFDNGYLLKENSKVSPYIYAGGGVSRLTDNMGRQCVNVGNHFSINGGVGVRYNINERVGVGYNLGLGCFMLKKVYASNKLAGDDLDHDEEVIKMEKRKDLILQNSVSITVNLF